MCEQLNIYNLLYPNRFCENEHINEIVELIEKNFSNSNLKLVKKEYSTWSHVPKLGKRLTMIWDLKTQQNIDKQAEFIDELKKNNYKAVVEIAEKYNIEISVAVTPYFIAFTTLNKKQLKGKKK